MDIDPSFIQKYEVWNVATCIKNILEQLSNFRNLRGRATPGGMIVILTLFLSLLPSFQYEEKDEETWLVFIRWSSSFWLTQRRNHVTDRWKKIYTKYIYEIGLCCWDQLMTESICYVFFFIEKVVFSMKKWSKKINILPYLSSCVCALSHDLQSTKHTQLVPLESISFPWMEIEWKCSASWKK